MHNYDNEEYTLVSGLKVALHRETNPSVRESRNGELLFLFHGLGAHSGTWRKNIPYFARLGFEVIAPTIPTDLHQIITLDKIEAYTKQIEELFKLMPKAAEDRKLTLVGNSMGGWLAMNLALENPRIVRSLILEDTAGVRETNNLLENKVEHTASFLDRLNQTAIPVLIAWGDQDRIIPIEYGHYLKSKIEKSSLIVFENTGHVPHWEKPDNFNAAVASFLSI